MAKTGIGLFEDPRRAQQVVHALEDDGFRREDIRTLTRPQEASVATLRAHGVPEAEAPYYVDGLHRGGTSVLVDAADERVDRAVAIMERAPAVDLGAHPRARLRTSKSRSSKKRSRWAGGRFGTPACGSIPV